MEYLKSKWKEILIIALTVLFVANCTGKGNYRRKYEKQVTLTEQTLDSVNNVYANTKKYIDSLQNEIRLKDLKISSMNNEIAIYVEQNNKLANKPVIVKVDKQTHD